jgi:hypothetical protein
MSEPETSDLAVHTGLEAFDRWMEGADPQHFLQTHLLPLVQDEQEREGVWLLFEVWNELFCILDEADPNRLDGKRGVFRKARTQEDLLALRAELVTAAKLALARVPFEFGKQGKPQPDLVLSSYDLGIEVKSRRVDGLWDLHNELENKLSEVDAPVTVHLAITERPLAIPKQKRQAVVNQVLGMVKVGRTGSFSADVGHPRSTRPNLTMHVQISPNPPVADGLRVFVGHGPLLGNHFADIETEVMAVLVDEQKVRQAESMPTILAVDIVRTGGPWLRSPAVWARALRDRLSAETPWIGVAPILLNLASVDCGIALALNPNAPAEALAAASSLAAALGDVQI